MEYIEDLRPISGLSGYAVNKMGSVFSCRPVNGKGALTGTWRKLKPLLCSKGRYLQFGADGRKMLIHRAVAETFLGPCPAGMEVSHKNGNSHDNRIENLEYLPHRANERMKRIHGTSPWGDRNGAAKLTQAQVEEIRCASHKDKARGAARRIAARYGVSEATVSMIRNGKRWAVEEF